MFSFTNQKKGLEEAKAQVLKIKSKGLELFLAECMRVILKIGPTRKKPHHQAKHLVVQLVSRHSCVANRLPVVVRFPAGRE